MEFVKKYVSGALVADSTYDFEVILPPAFSSVALHLHPTHAGGDHDPSQVEVFPYVAGAYRQEADSGGPGALPTNKTTTLTRSYGRMRVRITSGATPPDGGVALEVWGARVA